MACGFYPKCPHGDSCSFQHVTDHSSFGLEEEEDDLELIVDRRSKGTPPYVTPTGDKFPASISITSAGRRRSADYRINEKPKPDPHYLGVAVSKLASMSLGQGDGDVPTGIEAAEDYDGSSNSQARYVKTTPSTPVSQQVSLPHVRKLSTHDSEKD